MALLDTRTERFKPVPEQSFQSTRMQTDALPGGSTQVRKLLLCSAMLSHTCASMITDKGGKNSLPLIPICADSVVTQIVRLLCSP